MNIEAVHHIAIICSDYERSKRFYLDVLGCTVMHEAYREERDSYKLDLAVNGQYLIELFSFPHPPARASYPEACGLRHLAFRVGDLDRTIGYLKGKGVEMTEIQVDPYTDKRFLFFSDPDGLPIECYEESDSA